MKGWGPKSSVRPSKPSETKLFAPGYPGILPGYPGAPEKFENKMCVHFSSPKQPQRAQRSKIFNLARNFQSRSKFLMPLFLMGCFPVDFQEVKRPLRTKSGKRPIKVGKRPIKEGKRPIKAMVLVGVSVGCLMGCFRAPPPWEKTAPQKKKGPLRGL